MADLTRTNGLVERGWSSLTGVGTRALDEGMPPRLALVFFAFLLNSLAPTGAWIVNYFWAPGGDLMKLVLRLGSLAIVYVMSQAPSDAFLYPIKGRLFTALRWVAPLLVVGSLIQGAILFSGFRGPSAYGNDAIALTHYAAQTALEGENPYTHSNIVTVLNEFQLPSTRTTPLRQGAFAQVYPYPSEEQLEGALAKAQTNPWVSPPEFESKLSYPAGSFLFPAAWLALGFTDLRLFYLTAGVVILVAIYTQVSSRFRPLVILVALANVEFWGHIAGGNIDTLYAMFLILGWMWWRRSRTSAILMGLAAASKQIPWFYILFYLVLV
ncbi:MAG: DUF2029 domain-containing protein, partial [Chloroflexi bacterium]|nr:DUF2029 domain-containing protein [Chloroflexota bacterium]